MAWGGLHTLFTHRPALHADAPTVFRYRLFAAGKVPTLPNCSGHLR